MMTRSEMVAIFTAEYRKAMTRKRRIMAIDGRWSERFMMADGKVDGIVQAARAFDIAFYEIEGGE